MQVPLQCTHCDRHGALKPAQHTNPVVAQALAQPHKKTPKYRYASTPTVFGAKRQTVKGCKQCLAGCKQKLCTGLKAGKSDKRGRACHHVATCRHLHCKAKATLLKQPSNLNLHIFQLLPSYRQQHIPASNKVMRWAGLRWPAVITPIAWQLVPVLDTIIRIAGLHNGAATLLQKRQHTDLARNFAVHRRPVTHRRTGSTCTNGKSVHVRCMQHCPAPAEKPPLWTLPILQSNLSANSVRIPGYVQEKCSLYRHPTDCLRNPHTLANKHSHTTLARSVNASPRRAVAMPSQAAHKQ